MAAASGLTSGNGPATEKQRRGYWSRTSPSSPSHILHTPYHATIALLGVASFTSFSFCLVWQKPFDACLSAALVLLCLYIYTLQSERCQRKSEWRGSLVNESLSSLSTGSPRHSKAAARAAADGTSELDLTGYAKTLGMSIRNGVVHKEGSTLNRILMDALAKEYLRCMSALRCYQTTFGPLQEDVPEQDVIDSSAQSRTVSQEPSRANSRRDPLSTTLNTLNIGMDLAALSEPAAPTPRSPTGPPSPDPKRCRVINSGQLSALASEIHTPAPSAPANTPATGHPIDKVTDSSLGATSTEDSGRQVHRHADDEAPPPVWQDTPEVKSADQTFGEPAAESQAENIKTQAPVSFGLFGSSRRTDSL